MSVASLPEAQILALAEEAARPGAFDRWTYPDACYLADFWDGLHFLLAGGPDAQSLPRAALKLGDVTYRSGPEAAHAILSSTAQAFAAELQGLSEETLRGRFDIEAMLEAKVYPVRTWAFPEYAESTYRELMFYFERLKELAGKASKRGEGLLFYRYEDW